MTSLLSTLMAAVAAKTVTGKTAADLSAIEDSYESGALPVRFLYIGMSQTGGGGSYAPMVLGTSGVTSEFTWRFSDIYLYQSVAQGRGLKDAMPALRTYAAAYADMIAADQTFGMTVDPFLSHNVEIEIALNFPWPLDSATTFYAVICHWTSREMLNP